MQGTVIVARLRVRTDLVIPYMVFPTMNTLITKPIKPTHRIGLRNRRVHDAAATGGCALQPGQRWMRLNSSGSIEALA
jgi:hypothetical protein